MFLSLFLKHKLLKDVYSGPNVLKPAALGIQDQSDLPLPLGSSQASGKWDSIRACNIRSHVPVEAGTKWEEEEGFLALYGESEKVSQRGQYLSI